MPELPEVENVRRNIAPFCVGKKIRSVEVLREKNVVTGAEEFLRLVPAKSVLSLGRKGKYLIFHLSEGYAIVSHLRMEGRYVERREGDPKEKYDLLAYHFEDGSKLVYQDTRKFGTIGLYLEKDVMSKSPLAKLGEEPFSLSAEDLYSGLLRHADSPVKSALLDQSVVAGLGNIYADEVLFAAEIDPRTPCRLLTPLDAERLLQESRRILQEAIKEGGSTVHSYHPSEGEDGSMQNLLHAYGHANEACCRCGFRMKRIEIGGRGSVFCPRCQPSRQYPFVLAITGPIHGGKSTAARFFAEKGYAPIDCDEVVRSLYQDKKVLSAMRKSLGRNVATKGALNREFVREKASSNPAWNQRLQAFIHPLVKEEVLRRLAQIGPGKKAVLEVPLLLGSGLEDYCDFVLLVLSDPKHRAARLLAEGKDPEEMLRLNAGYPIGRAKAVASRIVANEGSEKEFLDGLRKLSEEEDLD